MNRPVGEWVRLGLFTPLIVRVVWYTTSPLRGAASQLRRAVIETPISGLRAAADDR